MNAILIILIIILIIIFYELICYEIRKIVSRRKHTRKKKLTKYVESGHNCSENTVKNYEELDDIVTENVDEDITKQITLSMIARYNLHDPDAMAKHEDRIMETIREFPEETAPHLDFIFDRIIPHRIAEMPPLIRDTPQIIYHVDAQNVHDSTVNESVRQMLEEIKTKESSTPLEVDKFMELKCNKLPQEDQNKLNAVLARINTNSIDRFNDLSEYEILQKVHKRCDNTEKQDLLISNLLDSHENGNVVCATGRLNRLVSTISALDDEIGKPIITKEMVRNESFFKAGTIRDQMLEKKCEEFVKKYNSNIEDKEVLDFTNSVKDEIKNKLTDDYAHLKSVDLNKIIDEATML